MGKKKTFIKKGEDPNSIFRHKLEILKEQIEPYKEYNCKNLIKIAKHALKIFTKEEISGEEENVYKLWSFAYCLERSIVRPHFKIRWNKILPLFDSFSGIFPKVYAMTYHRDKVIAAQKEYEDALAAAKKKREYVK